MLGISIKEGEKMLRDWTDEIDFETVNVVWTVQTKQIISKALIIQVIYMIYLIHSLLNKYSYTYWS